MSHDHDPASDPAPKPPAPNDAPSFGAGAFEASEPVKPREIELEPAAPLESSAAPSVIELGPSTSAAPERGEEPATPSEATSSGGIAHEPMHASAEPPPAPRAIAHEVEAVPFGRFEAPAPTIDVEARRPAPPPPAAPPPARARSAEPAAVPPIAAAEPASTSGASSDTARGAASSAPRTSDATSRWWSAFCHLFLVLDLVTLFLGTLLTLLVWQLAGKNDPLLDDQGREALNFQLNVAVLSALLVVSCVGGLLLLPVWIVATVLCILGAIRAANGERFRYPLIVRLVRA